jgi:hypothetical protein
MYHCTIPAISVRISIVGLDDSSIRRLQVFSSRRLDFDDGFVDAAI